MMLLFTDNLRLVRVYFGDDRSSPWEYIIHEKNVERFKEAFVRLHWDPGVNPHNNNKTAVLVKIDVWSRLREHGPYWWTTPDLMNNYDPNGVAYLDWAERKTIWERPKEVAEIEGSCYDENEVRMPPPET